MNYETLTTSNPIEDIIEVEDFDQSSKDELIEVLIFETKEEQENGITI